MKSFFLLLKSKIKSLRIASRSKVTSLFRFLPNVLSLLDVGASGGIEPRWLRVSQYLNYIGIEPDDCSNDDLDLINHCKEVHILKTFAWDKKELINFNLCKKGGVSSSFMPNYELLRSYPDSDRFDIISSQSLVAEP